MFSRLGHEIGYYDPAPDFDRLHIIIWLPMAYARNGGLYMSCRYISVLDAQGQWTIGDLKARIFAHPDAGGWTRPGDAVEDMQLFFRGQQLANTAALSESFLTDDGILHACTHPRNADAVATASEQLYSWLALLGHRRVAGGP